MESGLAILVLALFSSGQTNTDLVAFLPPQQYFQSRQIEVSIDKMMELAAADPKDARTQVMQLTALRYLTDEAENLKKAPKYAAHRQTLEQIAQGKKAQDALGFSKEYAGWLLAKLDGTKIVAGKRPLLREDAIAWFPAEASFLAAFDVRQVGKFGVTADPLKELLKMMRDEERKEIFNIIEKTGNVRAERFSMALVEHKDRDQQKIMIRLSGKANQAWLADTFKTLPFSRFETKELKDAQGTPITILQEPNRAPIIALVGNTDMLMVGYHKNDGKHEEIWEALKAVREKKQPGAAAGELKPLLAKIPDKALAMAVGNFPQELKREFRFLEATPTKLFGHIVRDVQGLDVNLHMTMANAADADKMVGKIGVLRKEGIAGLKQAQQKPLPQGMPPLPFAAILDTMESLQVQSQAEQVQVRLLVPQSLMDQVGTLTSYFMFGGGGGVGSSPLPPPPPPPVKNPK